MQVTTLAPKLVISPCLYLEKVTAQSTHFSMLAPIEEQLWFQSNLETQKLSGVVFMAGHLTLMESALLLKMKILALILIQK